jgi:2'-5' RNA ligase
MNKKRIQLTLFVDENESEVIETIRREFNPEQYKLIKSHLTLCREDELEQIEVVLQTLSRLDHHSITIDFGSVERFSDGKGVLIPARGNNEQFRKLREEVLQDVTKNPAKHEPHITLMHPRNATCSDSLFEQLGKFKIPTKLEFRKISLIEQEDGSVWRVRNEFELKNYIF